jgi:hypothetical protein
MFLLLSLLLVGTVFAMAAHTRLTLIGYPHARARAVFVAVMVAALGLGAIIVGPTADGIIDVSLQQAGLMGIVFIVANVLFLVVVRMLPTTGPPRRRSRSAVAVKPEMPRRPDSKWLLPVLVAGPGIFGFHLARAGQWVALAVLGALMIVVALQSVMVDLNYRRQKALTDTENGPAPVILLRSFAADRVSGREFAIAKAVRHRFGRFVALGNPNDETLPFGADRHYLSDTAWQVELTNLARNAQLILMLPDVTPSIRWELEMIRREELQTRFYVVQPRTHPLMFWETVHRILVGVEDPSDWVGFAEVLRDAGYQAVPETAPHPGFVIGFDSEARCVERARGLRRATTLVERILATPIP